MNEAELFWLRVFLSFIIGGTWLMLISVIAERKGTKLGGLLGGLPHTVLVALLFIGINQGADFAAESAASTVVPFIVNPFFLWLLATKARQSLKIALLLAATFWLAAMVVVRGLQLTDIWVNLVIWLAGMVVLLVRFQRILPVNDVKGAAVSFTKRQLTMRAVFAGVIIASAVIGGKYGGSVLGGILAGFPAGFLSTFVIAYYSRGLLFAQSFARTLMLSGAITPTVYVVAVHFLYPTVGLWWGTLIAFRISLGCMQYVVAPLVARLNRSATMSV